MSAALFDYRAEQRKHKIALLEGNVPVAEHPAKH